MPATHIEYPAAQIYNSTIPVIDITHLAEDQIQPPRTLHTFVNLTIIRHFCCICYLVFVSFIVFGCHYSHALNLKHLRGRYAYRLCNTAIKKSKQTFSKWSASINSAWGKIYIKYVWMCVCVGACVHTRVYTYEYMNLHTFFNGFSSIFLVRCAELNKKSEKNHQNKKLKTINTDYSICYLHLAFGNKPLSAFDEIRDYHLVRILSG